MNRDMNKCGLGIRHCRICGRIWPGLDSICDYCWERLDDES